VWRRLQLEQKSGGSTRIWGGVSPDGRWFAHAANNGVAHLLDADGKTVHEIKGPKYGEMPVAFSPDGKWLAAGAEGGVQIVDVATAQVARRLALPRSPAALAFSPDGARLVLGEAYEYKDINVSFWSAADGQMLKRIKLKDHARGVTELAFSADGRRVVMAADGHLWIGDAEGKVAASRAACARGLALSPDGSLVALANRGASTLCRFELADGSTGRTLKTLDGDSPSAVAIAPDGRSMASMSGYGDTTVRLYTLPDGTLTETIKVPGGAEAITFAADGKTLVLTSGGGLTVLRRMP